MLAQPDGEFDMNTVYTLHLATVLGLITGSAADAASIVDKYIAEARAKLKTEDCTSVNHGTVSCGKHRFVVKKSNGTSTLKTSDIEWTSKSASPKEHESASATGSNPIISPIGEWNVDDSGRRIRIGHCAQALCGVISAAKPPGDSVIGLPVLIDMMPTDTNHWEGGIYNTKDGKMYSGNLSLKNSNLLQVEGVAPHGLLLQNWMRADAK
jgi:uncharacterized protein (DUF2147 family)